MLSRSNANVMLLLALVAGEAFGHHGAFEYDMQKVLEFDGVIVESVWKNPHNLITLDTRSATGETIQLRIEAAGPSALRTIGVDRDQFVVGEQVTVVVSPSRRYPNRYAYGHRIVKADGSVVPLGPTREDARVRQTDVAAETIVGHWAPAFAEFMSLLASRMSWKLTDAGQAAFDSYTPAQSSQANCISVSTPWLMAHPVIHEIEQLEDRIVIRSDWLGGVARTIFLDGRAHPPDTEQFQQGHSIGRWENGELIVDTTNFVERIYAGIASSRQKHMVERITLSDDGFQLIYSFVLQDPVYLADSASGTLRLNYRPGLEPSGIECDIDIANRYLEENR